ncbi:MAG TPA: sigma-54 dependent transcriptional regulator [Terriglobales bacterium]|nr:sigma-54 dependent transcriptional regulator [Terriglobales bacterium]
MTPAPHILIADDQEAVRELCTSVATALGFRATGVASGREALKLWEQDPPDVLVCDVRLPDMGGVELLKRLKQAFPAVPVLLMTAYGTVGTAVEAMKLGAADYLTKPFELEEMRLLLQACVRQTQLEREARGLRQAARGPYAAGNLIGVSPAMQRVFRLIGKVAQSRYSVLILGESGTGKEIVARALHYTGPERDRPFLPVDCGALVPSLVESELFGYVKGAFTGAHHNHEGLLEVANGGTVFLDEIGELPLDLQVKLLRAIQEKEIRPVGGTRRVKIDVRIVAATNRDLQAAVADGSFRKDLFFRLNVVSIKLPPLRERAMDIPLLVEHFLERAAPPGTPPRVFSDEAMARLLGYEWPGNIRELENCVERTLALSAGPRLEAADLPSYLQQQRPRPATPQAAANASIRAIAEVEREAILDALTQVKGDKLLAAKLLGIGKTTLYRKLKEYAFAAQAGGGQ